MQPEEPMASLNAARREAGSEEGAGSGLSESIRALFERPDPPASEEDAPFHERDARDGFTTNVARFLQSDSSDRERLVPGILEDARTLKRSDAIRAVGNAVISLAISGDEAGDAEAMALAMKLLDTTVATHLAVRLGAEHEAELREPIVRVATLLPAAVAPALSDALAAAPDRKARRVLMDTLCVLGEPGRDAVLTLLEDPHWYTVRNGVALLGEMGNPEMVQALTVPLAHDDPRVRRETVTALAKIGSEDAGLLVAGMLDDPDPDVRAGAAMAAGVLKVERAQRPLFQLLGSEDEEEVQVQVIRALGQLGDPGAVPLIEKRATGSLFSRPPRPVRIAAFRALAAIGTPHARSVLEAAASDRDPEVRRAIEAILRDRSRLQEEAEAPETTPPVEGGEAEEAEADADVDDQRTAADSDDGGPPAEIEVRGSS